ncbi:MAG: 2'-5' RNA ligase family protein [bacterium]|nr:2'-5' RNA ligase family protein [bacterium]
MRYGIFYLVKGEAGQFHEKLAYGVAEKFDVQMGIKRKAPPHLTVKFPFQTDNIGEVENLVEEFCSRHRKTPVKWEGFGSTGKNMIFIKGVPSPEMRQVYDAFIDQLKTIPWMKWHDRDGENNPFAAPIAHTDVDESNFDAIWEYVNQHNPNYDLLFDNISILKLEDGIWKVHKEYLFKD